MNYLKNIKIHIESHYLINNENIDKDKLIKYIDILIFKDENMREHTIEDVIESIFNYFEGLTVIIV